MKNWKLIRYIKELAFRFQDDDVPALGAQMAYFFLLAVFPFLIVLMTVIGYSPISSEDVLEPLSNVLPYESYEVIRANVVQVTDRRNLRLMSIGFITTLWAASNGVGAVIRGLNKAYNEEEKRPFWMIKGVSLLCTIGLSLTIVLYFVLLIFGQQIGNIMEWIGFPPEYRNIWDQFRYMVIVVMMILVFAAFYHFTPSRRLRWREVFPGAIFTTVGWLLTSMAFAYYVNNFWNLSLVYGSIGGIVALLIWLFLSAMMIIMGGEVNAMLFFARVGREKPKGKKY